MPIMGKECLWACLVRCSVLVSNVCATMWSLFTKPLRLKRAKVLPVCKEEIIQEKLLGRHKGQSYAQSVGPTKVTAHPLIIWALWNLRLNLSRKLIWLRRIRFRKWLIRRNQRDRKRFWSIFINKYKHKMIIWIHRFQKMKGRWELQSLNIDNLKQAKKWLIYWSKPQIVQAK